VHGLIADGSAWNSGAAVLTAVFPMLLFIGVAGALYVLYTKPEVAPGHGAAARPISYTSIPGQPTTLVPGQPTADLSRTPAADRIQTSPAENETGAAQGENVAPKGDE
jgi:hypothetical protein